jgi:hypothetical protein
MVGLLPSAVSPITVFFKSHPGSSASEAHDRPPEPEAVKLTAQPHSAPAHIVTIFKPAIEISFASTSVANRLWHGLARIAHIVCVSSKCPPILPKTH